VKLEAPIRVGIVNDYEVVVRGLHDMLKDTPDLAVVELDSLPASSKEVDLALFDLFAANQRAVLDLHRLLDLTQAGKLVVYSWSLTAELIELARAVGVSGYLAKTMAAPELAEALIRIHRGERVYALPAELDDDIRTDWLGRKEGLSARESEVLALINRGLSNDDITKRLYLSINSVKSYIRSAYRKMGVLSRTRALLWGQEHGFQPQPKRGLFHIPRRDR